MGQSVVSYTKIPNALLEKLAKSNFSAQALRVLLVVIRKTYGWGKPDDAISYSQFVEATGMVPMEGINDRSLARVISQLEYSGALVRFRSPGKITVYSIPVINDKNSIPDVDSRSDIGMTKPLSPTTHTIDKRKASSYPAIESITHEDVVRVAREYSVSVFDTESELGKYRDWLIDKCKTLPSNYLDRFKKWMGKAIEFNPKLKIKTFEEKAREEGVDII